MVDESKIFFIVYEYLIKLIQIGVCIGKIR